MLLVPSVRSPRGPGPAPGWPSRLGTSLQTTVGQLQVGAVSELTDTPELRAAVAKAIEEKNFEVSDPK